MHKVEINGWISKDGHFLSTFSVYTERQPLHDYNNRKYQNKVTVTIEMDDEQYEEYLKVVAENGPLNPVEA